MKILVICFIIFQVVVLVTQYINIQQTYAIQELQKEVACLRMDKLYVGGEWCGKK